MASYRTLAPAPQKGPWTRSASVTQLLSSWTNAAADGPDDLLTARVLSAGFGPLKGGLTVAAEACDLPLRRAGLAIATDILPQKLTCRSPRRSQLRPHPKNCGAQPCSW